LRYLAAGLSEFGFDCSVSLHPLTSNKTYYSNDSIAHRYRKSEKDVYREIDTDVIIEINRFRSDYINKNTIHINWIQDLPLREFKHLNHVEKNSINYLYGSPAFFGLNEIEFTAKPQKILLAGYRPVNSIIKKEQRYDINLLGYMSTIFEVCGPNDDYFASTHRKLIKKTFSRAICEQFIRKPSSIYEYIKSSPLGMPSKFFATNEFMCLLKRIKSAYEPLSGSLNMNLFPKSKKYFISELCNYLLLEYPRYKDRLILFELIKKLDSRYQKIIAGPNWKNYFPEFSYVKDPKDEIEIFSQSKLTVHNNTHGLGLHPRIFECLAHGSFPLMHDTPHRSEEGALNLALEPDRHFGLYSRENFHQVAESWITNTEKRRKGIIEAQKIVEKSHSWRKRAQQIISDLNEL
jgi:hypothetical protein